MTEVDTYSIMRGGGTRTGAPHAKIRETVMQIIITDIT